jgi:TPR repeat protein
VEQNYPEAIRLLLPAAQEPRCDKIAQYELGRILLAQTPTTITSLVEALEWLHMSASQSFALAQCKIGKLFITGLCHHSSGFSILKQDVNNAIHWLQLAVDQGCTQAQYALASLVLGKAHPAVRNVDRGIYLLEQAAAKKDLLAMHDLGCVYVEHSINLWKAYQLIEQVVALDTNHTQAPNALYNLGRMWMFGLGGKKRDGKKAYEYYRLAAQHGVIEAQKVIQEREKLITKMHLFCLHQKIFPLPFDILEMIFTHMQS